MARWLLLCSVCVLISKQSNKNMMKNTCFNLKKFGVGTALLLAIRAIAVFLAIIFISYKPNNSYSQVSPSPSIGSQAIKNKQSGDRLYLPDSIPYPNGITVTSGGSVYVGSVTTGAVAKIEPRSGKLLVAPQTAIIASNSLRADEARGVLWACSSDVFPTNGTFRKPSTLVELDLNDGTVIKTIKLPQNGFCNDLAIDDRGGVLVTDSLNPQILYLPPDKSEFEVWTRDERFGVTEGFGLAGIAIASDGIYVGMFANGQLYRIRNRQVEPLKLARNLNNPDGMAIAPDGSLIVCEGNYQSGNGRLLRINLSDSDSTGNIEVLAEGLDSPVNLSLNNKTAWVTEGRLRGLLSPELNLPQPDSFWVRRIPLALD